MAQVTIQIPDAVAQRVTDAFAATYPGRTPKQLLIEYIKTTVRNHEAALAQAAQAEQTDSDINPT